MPSEKHIGIIYLWWIAGFQFVCLRYCGYGVRRKCENKIACESNDVYQHVVNREASCGFPAQYQKCLWVESG